MKLTQIHANPQDWDLSILRAVGVERNGRKLSPIITALTAKALPEPHLSVWRAAVEQFRALGRGEWDESHMTVHGVTLDAGWSLPSSVTQMPVKAMDAEHLAIWHAAVEQFRAIGGGDWIAASVTVTKTEGSTTSWKRYPDQPPVEIVRPTALICDVEARRDDKSVKRIQIPLEDAAMIEFFDYFTSSEAWINPPSTHS